MIGHRVDGITGTARPTRFNCDDIFVASDAGKEGEREAALSRTL